MHQCNNTHRRKNKQDGSIILAIIAMATLGSIAMLTTMSSIKSLNKILAMEKLQDNAQQTLSLENSKTISDYLLNPGQHITSGSSTLLADGVEYTYRQDAGTKQKLNWPMPGFSLNSNYISNFIILKSQISMSIIKTPILTTGISCIEVSNKALKTTPERHYTLVAGNRVIESIKYDFNPDTGDIWKITDSGSKRLLDIDIMSNQTFSRADFAVLQSPGKTKLAIIFAVVNSQNTGHAQQNRLYILFDEIYSYEHLTKPITSNELIILTGEYMPTGDENGFIVTLKPGQMELSAITTVDHRIIFVTQHLQLNAQTPRQTYLNELYQIDLAAAGHRVIQTRLLGDSTSLLELNTRFVNESNILIGTQLNPVLIASPVRCKQVFQHEE